MLSLMNTWSAKEGIFSTRYVYFDVSASVSMGQAVLASLSALLI